MSLIDNMKENRFWSNVHKDWNMYNINRNIYYRIVNFENLDEKFKKCKNLWHSYGDNVNELALVNALNPEIYIGSIKIWRKSYAAKIFQSTSF